MRYFIQTLGCQMNYSDSERVSRILEDIGYRAARSGKDADVLIFNTCSVRQKAEDRVYGQVRNWKKLRGENPLLRVGLTGCMVRQSSTRHSAQPDALLRQLKGLDFVFRIEDLGKLPELLNDLYREHDDLYREHDGLYREHDGLYREHDDLHREHDDLHRERDGLYRERAGTAPFEKLHHGEPHRERAGLHRERAGIKDFDSGSLKGTAENFVTKLRFSKVPQDYFDIYPKTASRFQAFLPIMTGCDHFCTYCIVPYSRGREKSRHVKALIKEAKKLIEDGCIEIILLGQKVNGFGLSALDKKSGAFRGMKHPFSDLLRALSKLDSLLRIRFTSSHPEFFTDELIETIAELQNVCPHIHLPVQSGDNNVLKRMNRRYTISEYRKILEKIRSAMPECAISTDIIVGFCGETEKEFLNTYRLFEEVRFDMAYIAEYSPREGTVAAKRMEDDVPREEKARRKYMLNDLLKRISHEKHLEYVGRTVDVLVEKCERSSFQETPPQGNVPVKKCKNNVCSGRTDTFKLVHFPGRKDLIGAIVPVKVMEAKEWILTGELM